MNYKSSSVIELIHSLTHTIELSGLCLNCPVQAPLLQGC